MKEDPDHSEEKVSVNQPQEKKPAGRPKLIKNNKSQVPNKLQKETSAPTEKD